MRRLFISLWLSLQVRCTTSFLSCYAYYGEVTDLGWTYQHNLARAHADEQLGTSSKYVENVAFMGEAAQRAVIDSFLADDCDLIFLGSGSFTILAADYAIAHPSQKFIGLGVFGPNLDLENLGGAVVKIYQASYISGIIAAKQGYKKLGYVGSTYMSESVLAANAFYLGAMSVGAPGVEVFVLYTGGWLMLRAERIAAARLFARHGVEIIAFDSDSWNLVKYARDQGKKSFSMKADGAAIVGETNLAAQLYFWKGIVKDAIIAAKAGDQVWKETRNKNMFVGFEKGAVSYGTLSSEVTEDARQAALAARQRFEAGNDPVFCNNESGFPNATCPPGAMQPQFFGGGFPPGMMEPFKCRTEFATKPCLDDFDRLSLTWLVENGSGLIDLGLLTIPDHCPPGTFEDPLAEKVCVPCAPGKFSDLADQSECSSCKPGFYQDLSNSTGCKPCAPGNFSAAAGAVQCQLCDPGEFSDGVTSACSKCPKGTYRAEPGGAQLQSCTVCPRNTFAASAGSTECTYCPNGLATREISSASVDQCVCPVSTYRLANISDCSPCPGGMECPTGSASWHFIEADKEKYPRPLVTERYWSSPENPTVVFICESAARCPGSAPGSCAPKLVGRACAHCEDGYTWAADECRKCQRFETRAVLAWVALCLFPIVIMFLYKDSGSPIERWNSWRYAFVSLGFVLLSHLQVVNVITQTNLALPQSEAAATFVELGVLNDIFAILSIRCAGFTDFRSSTLLRVSAPVGMLAITVSMWFVSIGVARVLSAPSWAMQTDRLFNAFMSLIFTFFSAVVALACSLFRCIRNPNDVHPYSLKSDFAVICYQSDDWVSMSVVGGISFLVYCVGCGALYIRAVIVAPKYFGDSGWRTRWQFLFVKFRSDSWWFAMVFMFKNMLLQLGLVFFVDSFDQICWMMFVIIAYMGVCVFAMAFREPTANIVDMCGCLCQMFVCFLIREYVEPASVTDEEISNFSLAVTSMPILFAVVVAVRIAKKKRDSVRIQRRYKKVLQRVRVSCETVCAEDENRLMDFMERISDWDRSYLLHFDAIVSAELFPRRKGKKARLATIAIKESQDSITDSANLAEGRPAASSSTAWSVGLCGPAEGLANGAAKEPQVAAEAGNAEWIEDESETGDGSHVRMGRSFAIKEPQVAAEAGNAEWIEDESEAGNRSHVRMGGSCASKEPQVAAATGNAEWPEDEALASSAHALSDPVEDSVSEPEEAPEQEEADIEKLNWTVYESPEFEPAVPLVGTTAVCAQAEAGGLDMDMDFLVANERPRPTPHLHGLGLGSAMPDTECD